MRTGATSSGPSSHCDATAAAAAFKATFNDPAASEQLRAIAYQRLTAQGPQAMAAAAVLEADRGPPSPSCTCPTARTNETSSPTLMRPPPAMMSAAAGWGSASSMTCGQLSHRQLPATYRGPRASPLGPSHLGAHAAAAPYGWPPPQGPPPWAGQGMPPEEQAAAAAWAAGAQLGPLPPTPAAAAWAAGAQLGPPPGWAAARAAYGFAPPQTWR